MNLDRDFLARIAAETGFRGEMLEKVAHLLNLLRAIRENDFLRTRLALKGGTAINLFHFDLSRLSVDIDFNYVGAAEREIVMAERPDLETRLSGLCEREGYGIRHTRMRNLPAASGSCAMRRRMVARATLKLISTICFACHYGR
jgi:hypothetical protein